MSSISPETDLVIYTIGHSNHELTAFLELLRRHQIEVLVDVRSRPYSAYTPHFSRQPLREAITAAGIKYLFFGKELGGRPDGEEYYEADGRVNYAKVAASVLFRSGIERLHMGIARFRVAMLCAEEDPTGCHRRLLVARVLAEEGIAVLHIRGDGRVQPEEELLAEESKTDNGQLALFDTAPGKAWTSARPVRIAVPPHRQSIGS